MPFNKENNSIKICMLSCTHGVEDDRIFWKECLSLKKQGYDIVHIAGGSTNNNYTSAEGIECIEIKRATGGLKSKLRFYQAIYKAAAKQQAAAYHLHDWQLHVLTKSLRQLPCKPKLVYDAHESTELLLQQDVQDKKPPLLKKLFYQLKTKQATSLEKKTIKLYDAIITAEEFVMQSLPIAPTQLQQVLHNYSFFESSSVATQKKYDVIYAGLLAKNRGMLELIDAVALLQKRQHPISVLLIGSFCDNVFKITVEEKIAAAGLQQHISIHPAVPYQVIKQYLLESKIGICAWQLTPKNKEAIPIKIFEYMACGLPVIFSTGGAATTYIADSEAGLLVNPAHPAEIADAIQQLLTDTTFYNLCAANGAKAIATSFNWTKEAKKLINLYTKLLN